MQHCPMIGNSGIEFRELSTSPSSFPFPLLSTAIGSFKTTKKKKKKKKTLKPFDGK
jgi:hypothetical protein